MGKFVVVDTSKWIKCGNQWNTGSSPKKCIYLEFNPLLGVYICNRVKKGKLQGGILNSANGGTDVRRADICVENNLYKSE